MLDDWYGNGSNDRSSKRNSHRSGGGQKGSHRSTPSNPEKHYKKQKSASPPRVPNESSYSHGSKVPDPPHHRFNQLG